MRILLITNVFPNPCQPTKGPFNLKLAQALARKHQLVVVSPLSWVDELQGRRRGVPPLPSGRRLEWQGIDVLYPRFYYSPKICRGLYGWFLWYSVRTTIRSVLARFRPDTVLGYWAHPDGEVAIRAARTVGVPAVVMVGGSDILVVAHEPGRLRPTRKVLREADAVITTSQDLQTRVTHLGVESGKVHVIYRGVDKNVFCPADRQEARRRLGIPVDGQILLWVGRLVPVKGIDVLLQACAILRKRNRPFHLYLVGGGPLREGLEKESRAAGLADNVSFIGPCPHSQLADWYRATDLMVLPSRSEGVPNVLREALACGTPFVASRVGGIPEITEPGWGRLVQPDDPQGLADAIGGALTVPPSSLPPYHHPASWDESADALMQVIRSLVPRSKERAS